MKLFFKGAIIAILILAGFIGFSYATENIVDDFDDGADPSFWGGGVWTINIVNTYDSDIQRTPNPGYSRKITWNISSDWAGFVINGLNDDVSGYNYFSFWIYTPNPGTDIKVELQDTDDDQGRVLLRDYLITGTSVWQHVSIPIEAFEWDNSSLDLSNLKEIKWTSDYNDGNDSSGTIYLDDISFLVQSHAPAGQKLVSGGDRGVQGVCDIPGDTLIRYDQADSSTTTNEVNVRVSTAYAAAWASTPSDGAGAKNASVYVAYQIRNDGNIADIMSLSTATLTGYPYGGETWVPAMLWDKDKSGTFTAGDIANWNTIGLIPDSTYFFLVKVDIPSDAVLGSSSTVKITAKTNNGSGANDNWPAGSDNDTIIDTFTVTYQAPNIIIYKSASLEAALPITESVTVTINYENSGNQAATNFIVTEALPYNTYLDADPTTDSADAVQFYVGSAWQGAYSATATKIRWIDNSVPASSGALTLDYIIRAR